jgi:hypothetical protein
MKAPLLVICFNNLKNDARVMRQINFLKETYDLTVFCHDACSSPDYEIYKVEKTKLTFFRKAITSVFLLLGLYTIAYRLLYDYDRHIRILRNRNFHVILANDIETLPLAIKIAGERSKIFFDAHEYAPRQFEDRLYWRIFFQRFTMHLCQKFIPKTHGMSTINAGLAKEYQSEFGVNPTVITNATNYVELQPVLRDHYPIRLVHHGIFTISRQPELMIDLMQLLDERFTLDLIYLLPDSASRKTREMFESFKSRAIATRKINILPPLKGDQIVPALHKTYDMGIILVPPVNFNYENGLPNKLFDCIQARLGMAVGPLREIARITTDHGIGVISKDFTPKGLAAVLNPLTIEDIWTFKKNASIAATKLNAELNREILLRALQKIT